MRVLKLSLLLAIASTLLMVAPVLADSSPITVTIVNNSGYSDSEVYILMYGKTPGGIFQHLNLTQGTLSNCTSADNTVTVYETGGAAYPDLYCNYYLTLDQLTKNPDGSYSFQCPQIDSGRVFLSILKPVYLHINESQDAHGNTVYGVREPSAGVSTDPNYATTFDKCEITYDTAGVHANMTPIDFVGLSLQMKITEVGGGTVGPVGFNRPTSTIFDTLDTDSDLATLNIGYRHFSPDNSPAWIPTFPTDYLGPYIEHVWTKTWQEADSLKFIANLKAYTGSISGDVLSMALDTNTSEVHTISKPSSNDVFACGGTTLNPSSPAGAPGGYAGRDADVKNMVCSALNRTVMHLPVSSWSVPAGYYKQNGLSADDYRTNVYSKLLHSIAINNLMYGFPFDDHFNQASYISTEHGTGVTITINLADTAPSSAPGAPTNVTATAGDAQATVSFSAPASPGGSAIKSYTVTSNPGAITKTGASSPLTVTGLTNGTSYTFTVKATNDDGTGPASEASNSVTPGGVPGAPTGVTATAGNAQATVSFTAPASTGGSAIKSYTVTSSPGGLTKSGASSPLTVTGLTNGTAYTFTVKATNDNGTGPASSASSAVTPASVPGAPTGVSATAGNAQATVSFSAPASTGGSAIISYTVTSIPGGLTKSGASSPLTVTGLTNGTAYSFTVTATNAKGTGAASAASNSVTPGGVPGAPTGVTATAGNAQATVSFSAPASTGGSAIISYTVTSSPGGLTKSGASSPLTVTGLTNGTAYTFRVTAANAVGTGPASAASKAVTPKGVPSAPTGVTATAGNAQATVSFTAPSSTGGSAIKSYTVTSSPGGLTKTGASSPLTVTGLTNGTAYTFKVTAANAVGTGPASAASKAVTPKGVPSAPTGVTATAGNAQATVSFTAPSSNGGSSITLYTVTSSIGGIKKTAKKSPIVVKGLTNGKTYTFTVTATNAIGTGPASKKSNKVTPSRFGLGAPGSSTIDVEQ